MASLVPAVGLVVALTEYLKTADLTLKLFSNNVTPANGNTAASYTSVAGGGYAAKTLTAGSWSIVSGDPSYGVYAAQDFEFTGATSAPGTIYGYYIVDASNVVIQAERFAAGVVPFTPANGSLIRITPKLEATS